MEDTHVRSHLSLVFIAGKTLFLDRVYRASMATCLTWQILALQKVLQDGLWRGGAESNPFDCNGHALHQHRREGRMQIAFPPRI
jgi:hypothetical protein